MRVSNTEGPTTAQIVKQKDMPAKCGLCGGNHPANYKGCEHYHNIIKGNNPHRTPPVNSNPLPMDTYVPTKTQPSLPLQQRSYAEVVRNDTQHAEEPLTAIKVLLEDFKGLFAQLLHQNSLILTLILRCSRTGTVWFYTSTSNKRAARPKLYTKSLTGDLKRMYSRFSLVRISINL